jgi:hypothetical protein
MGPVDVFWLLPISPNLFTDLVVAELGTKVHDKQQLLCDRWVELDMCNGFCVEYWTSIYLARKVISLLGEPRSKQPHRRRH